MAFIIPGTGAARPRSKLACILGGLAVIGAAGLCLSYLGTQATDQHDGIGHASLVRRDVNPNPHLHVKPFMGPEIDLTSDVPKFRVYFPMNNGSISVESIRASARGVASTAMVTAAAHTSTVVVNGTATATAVNNTTTVAAFGIEQSGPTQTADTTQAAGAAAVPKSTVSGVVKATSTFTYSSTSDVVIMETPTVTSVRRVTVTATSHSHLSVEEAATVSEPSREVTTETVTPTVYTTLTASTVTVTPGASASFSTATAPPATCSCSASGVVVTTETLTIMVSPIPLRKTGTVTVTESGRRTTVTSYVDAITPEPFFSIVTGGSSGVSTLAREHSAMGNILSTEATIPPSPVPTVAAETVTSTAGAVEETGSFGIAAVPDAASASVPEIVTTTTTVSVGAVASLSVGTLFPSVVDATVVETVTDVSSTSTAAEFGIAEATTAAYPISDDAYGDAPASVLGGPNAVSTVPASSDVFITATVTIQNSLTSTMPTETVVAAETVSSAVTLISAAEPVAFPAPASTAFATLTDSPATSTVTVTATDGTGMPSVSAVVHGNSTTCTSDPVATILSMPAALMGNHTHNGTVSSLLLSPGLAIPTGDPSDPEPKLEPGSSFAEANSATRGATAGGLAILAAVAALCV